MENVEVVVSGKLINLGQERSKRIWVLAQEYIMIDWQGQKKAEGCDILTVISFNLVVNTVIDMEIIAQFVALIRSCLQYVCFVRLFFFRAHISKRNIRDIEHPFGLP